VGSQLTHAACECLWEGAFADVHAKADLVASVSVAGSKGNSIDVTVDRTMHGDANAQSIRVWLAAKDYCRPPASLFPKGSQWVVALHEIKEEVPGGFSPHTPNISFGRLGDYSLSSCGGYWLSQTGAHVTGNLVSGARWEREPKMTPVLIDLVEAYVGGKVPRSALLEASRIDPALRELMLDTRSFLRHQK